MALETASFHIHIRKPSLAKAKSTVAEQPLQYLHCLYVMNKKETPTSRATYNFHQHRIFLLLDCEIKLLAGVWALSHIH